MPEKKVKQSKKDKEQKPKSNPKSKPKSKSKPKPEPKEKVNNGKVIVEIENKERSGNTDQLYNSKLKSLLNKIKSQSESQDSGIRFAWRKI